MSEEKGLPVVTGKDPGRGHFYASIVKSLVRFGAAALMIGWGASTGGGGAIALAGVLLLIAEILGIVEEIV